MTPRESEPRGESAPERPAEEASRLARFFRRRITAGLIFLIPFALTVWIAVSLFRFADGILGRYANALLRHYELIARPVPFLGLLLLFLLLLLVGFFATSRLGQRLTAPIERWILSIPVIKSIYGGTKQILQAFALTGRGGAFENVCLVEYPHRGMFAIGFVTGRITKPLHTPHGDYGDLFTVFVPTTPNPTSGFLVLSPVAETYLLDMSIEEGIKVILSGGFVQADLDLLSQSQVRKPGEKDTHRAG